MPNLFRKIFTTPSQSFLLSTTTSVVLLAGSVAHATPLTISSPTVDRWNVAVNSTPGYRSTSSAFSSAAPANENFLTTQLLIFDTTEFIPSGQSAANYTIRSASLTLDRDPATSYIYDPSFDALDVHTNGAPDDPGHPVELYGAAFRSGFSASTYVEGSPETAGTPWGPSGVPPFTPGIRYAYPTDAFGGSDRDVSSHVIQELAINPFAIGTVAGLSSGDLVSGPGSTQFDLALTPDVVSYLQQGLSDGALGFHVASHIVPNGSDNADFPSFYNKESGLGVASVTLEAAVVPEPATGILLSSGLIVLAIMRRLTQLRHSET